MCAALATGNIEAMALVYDAYADRLFGYALGVTGSREAAADAVSDTLLLAHARFRQLRDRSKLRPWLYAICRNECLRGIRVGNRFAPLEAAGEVADVATDPVAGVVADDARHLIESAFQGMNESDREVIELALRHELSPTQISEIIGVSPNNASARLSAAKVQLERAVGALLLLRSRGSSCEDLRKIVSGQSFTPLLRKRIVRHSEQCPECTSTRKRAVAVVAMATLPVIAAPAWLRDGFLAGASNVAAVSNPIGGELPTAADFEALRQRTMVLDRERSSFDREGWPRRTDHSTRRVALAAALGAGLIAVGLVIGWSAIDRDEPPVDVAEHQLSVVAPAEAPGEPVGTPSSAGSPTAAASRPVSPRPSASASTSAWTSSASTPRPTRPGKSATPRPTVTTEPSRTPAGSGPSDDEPTVPVGPNFPGMPVPTIPLFTIPPAPVPIR